MEWNYIKTNEDIEKLMKTFGGFHDSCIKEISYISGAYVNEDLSIQPSNNKREVKVLFERQLSNPTSIEMVFEKVSKLNLAPIDERYDCVILDSFMEFVENKIYWADCSDLDIHDIREYDDYTWICAESVKWRIFK